LNRETSLLGAVAKHRDGLRRLICEAYRQGFSMFEIVRITGAKNPSFYYKTLREERLFPLLRRGRPKKSLPLPPQIKKLFSGFSLCRWANMWGFSQEEVEIVLSTDSYASGTSAEIHSALQRDFPIHYKELYPSSPLNDRPTVRFQKNTVPPFETLAVHLRFDEERQWFVATITSDPALEGHGMSWSAAITDLERIWWVQKSAIRLKHALEINTSACSCSGNFRRFI